MQITTKMEIMQVLTGILREVFDDDSLVASEDMTAADVEKWDSLSHLDLIVAVEHRFRVKLTTREVTSLKNIGQLTELVQKKLSPPGLDAPRAPLDNLIENVTHRIANNEN